jgi:hypothetical protein
VEANSRSFIDTRHAVNLDSNYWRPTLDGAATGEPALAIGKNKLARQAAGLRARSNAVRDNEPTVDQQLTRLEDDIRRLKIEFDIYFNGSVKRPPYDTKGRVETVIKRLGDDRSMTYAQKYLYNSLVARYTAFRELWRRTMKGREEGRDPQSVRIAQQHEVQQQRPSSQLEPATFVCADATKDVDTVKGLYSALIEAKKMCNEPVDDMQFARFHHMIATKTASLKEHFSCDKVKFSVGIENGKVTFKAKANEE